MAKKKPELVNLLRCSNLLVAPKEVYSPEVSNAWWTNKTNIFPQNTEITVKNLLSTIETTTKYLESTGCYKAIQVKLDSCVEDKNEQNKPRLNMFNTDSTWPEITIIKCFEEKKKLFGSINFSVGKNTYIEIDAGLRNILCKLETFQSKLKIGSSFELENKLQIPFLYHLHRRSPESSINTIYGSINLNNKITKDKNSKGVGINIKDAHKISFNSSNKMGLSKTSKYELNYKFTIPLYTNDQKHIAYNFEENILDEGNDIDENSSNNVSRFNYNKKLFKLNIDCKSRTDRYNVHYKFKRLLFNKAFFFDKTYFDWSSCLKLSIRRKTAFDELSVCRDKNIKFSLRNGGNWNIENTSINIGSVLKKIYIKNTNTVEIQKNTRTLSAFIKGGIKTKFGNTGFKLDILNLIKDGDWNANFTWKLNK